MTKRILVTGGAGNVGGSLARRLVEDPNNYVVIVDSLLTGSTSKMPNAAFKNWHFVKANVNDRHDISPIVVSGQFDYIFHYAAVVGVQRTLQNPKMVLDDIDGIRNILDLAKNTGVKRVFFSSSSEVYGEPVEIPQVEATTPLNSRLPYAIVKNVGEAFCRSYQQEYGLDYTVFRFFNTYGPLQSEDFVISKFIGQAIRNDDITIYGDGSQTRTFCYVDDNVSAVVSAMEQDFCVNDVMNVGSDNEISVIDLAKRVVKLLGSSSKIAHLPPLKEGDMTRRKPDITKMRDLLGRDLISLDEGILRTADYIRSTLIGA